MEQPVPDRYLQLLEQEVCGVSFENLDEISRIYDAKKTLMTKIGGAGNTMLLNRAEKLRSLLNHAEKLNERQLFVALGALQYFVRDEDEDPDQSSTGDRDDALVLDAALHELRDVLQLFAR